MHNQVMLQECLPLLSHSVIHRASPSKLSIVNLTQREWRCHLRGQYNQGWVGSFL